MYGVAGRLGVLKLFNFYTLDTRVQLFYTRNTCTRARTAVRLKWPVGGGM